MCQLPQDQKLVDGLGIMEEFQNSPQPLHCHRKHARRLGGKNNYNNNYYYYDNNNNNIIINILYSVGRYTAAVKHQPCLDM